MLTNEIDTPCVGICSTVYGDHVCRGCKRYYNEIIEWNAYNNQQKQMILDRLEKSICDAVIGKLEIIDTVLLQQQLDKFNIRYRAAQNPFCWTYYLLQEAHQNIHDIKKYGIVIADQYATISLAELYQLIESELLDKAKEDFILNGS